jgi:hypothetical protein
MSRNLRTRTRQRRGSTLGALASGLAGTLALSLVERLERRTLGRLPLYAATRIASRLAHRWSGPMGPAATSALGGLMRWSYGPALALIRNWLVRSPRAGDVPALSFGAGIYAFELIVLPATGATPPLRRWPPLEVLLLAAHTLTYALATVFVAERVGLRPLRR